MIDRQGREDQAEEEEAPAMFLDSVCKHEIILRDNQEVIEITIIWTY